MLFHIGSILIPSYGAITAFGVLVGLALTQRTARLAGIDPGKLWNLSILGLFAALAAARLLLVIANWSALRSHPAWLLGLAMVHHPLLAGMGALAGAACALWYAHHVKLSLAVTGDALAVPIAAGFAFEQIGALASGSGYGVDADPHFALAIIYSNPLANLWSGVSLGVPLQPVQAYTALAFFALAILLRVWLPLERRAGDVAGLGLMGSGIAIYVTEFWRDPEGRGSILGGSVDGPQITAVFLILAGAWILRERKTVSSASAASSPASEDQGSV